MRLYEYQRSRSFIDLGPIQSDSIFLNFFSSVTADFNISSALRWAIQDQWSSGHVLFLICHTSISSVCKINACHSESYNSDVQPNLEYMDSSNTGMSYELDILLFNF